MTTMNSRSSQKAKNQFSSKYSECEETRSVNSSNASSNESMGREVNDSQMKYRTELCKFFEISGMCKFGPNCIFAHGKENLREKVLVKSGYKKRECLNFFENGLCLYGNRCQFSHEIRESIFSYKTVMKKASNGSIGNASYDIFKRPRLNVFRAIIKRTKKKKRKKTYFDDIVSQLNPMAE